jgi:hypothetical protein
MAFSLRQAALTGATFASLTIALPALAQSDAFARGYEIINSHGSARIVAVWFARAGTRDPWAPVNMSVPIEPKRWRKFDVTGGNGTCMFDFRVKFDDGVVQEFGNIDVCKQDRMIAT